MSTLVNNARAGRSWSWWSSRSPSSSRAPIRS